MPGCEQPLTHALDRAAIGIRLSVFNIIIYDHVLASSLITDLNQNESLSTAQKQNQCEM
jgi:hypothetical protein